MADPIPCDVCGPVCPATRFRRATPSRERAFYCDDCARKYVGWPEKTRPLTPGADVGPPFHRTWADLHEDYA